MFWASAPKAVVARMLLGFISCQGRTDAPICALMRPRPSAMAASRPELLVPELAATLEKARFGRWSGGAGP